MPMASADDIRQELDELGERRQRLDEEETQLMTDVGDCLRRAEGVVSVTEAAERLHMHRTTIYRVYRPKPAA